MEAARESGVSCPHFCGRAVFPVMFITSHRCQLATSRRNTAVIRIVRVRWSLSVTAAIAKEKKTELLKQPKANALWVGIGVTGQAP